MSRSNTPPVPQRTFEGGVASHSTPLAQLRRLVNTCLLWEDTFYEGGDSIAAQIQRLVPQVAPQDVAALAVHARTMMNLRHASLWLTRCLAADQSLKCHAHHPLYIAGLVESTLHTVIQRADEMGEFLALYWRGQNTRVPAECDALSAQVKRGLASAFGKFNEYQLAKYDRDTTVRLRDVLRLVHPVPSSPAQADLWGRVKTRTLAVPDTWETALSSGADKRATWERLLTGTTLGGLAVLRNLRNMIDAGVDLSLIQARMARGLARVLPYRYITAARYVPTLEPELELGMYTALHGISSLPGHTVVMIDVSGSMRWEISRPGNVVPDRGGTSRMDVACGLAVLLRELCQRLSVITFSNDMVEVPSRRGFALRDAIVSSQHHGGTYLRKAQDTVRGHRFPVPVDRVIILTDEQSGDGCAPAWVPDRSYIINVAPHVWGVGDTSGWAKISGWSERVLEYIGTLEGVDGMGTAPVVED